MTVTTTMAADGVVAFLLIATIIYAAVLNRRLGRLRADKAELQALIQSFAAASQQAEAGVAGLKSTAEEIGRKLEKKVEQAQSLREDLTYMIERGGMLADRLETTIRARREEPRSEGAKPRPLDRAPAAERSRIAERLRPVETTRAEPRLKAEANIMAAAVAAAAETPAPAAAPSRAERNLLRALAGRR